MACSQRQMHTVHKTMDLTHTHFMFHPFFLPQPSNTRIHHHTHIHTCTRRIQHGLMSRMTKPWSVTINPLEIITSGLVLFRKEGFVDISLQNNNVLHTPSMWYEPAPGDPSHDTRSHQTNPLFKVEHSRQGKRRRRSVRPRYCHPVA